MFQVCLVCPITQLLLEIVCNLCVVRGREGGRERERGREEREKGGERGREEREKGGERGREGEGGREGERGGERGREVGEKGS